ncbi:MAG: rod shape-determining protein MreC [Myxococcales bacterium]|nr:rod shape-determining protein MreC [Myxococcales bacterium]
MNPSKRVWKLVIPAVLLLLPALLLRSSIKAPERMNPVDRLLVRITAPLQGVVVGAGSRVGGVWSHYIALVGVKRENERLAAENAALRSQVASLSQLAARAERLERLLELRAQIQADTLAAQVIGVETSRQFRVLRLRLELGGLRSAGPGAISAAETRPGMPVLSPSGVVGRVLRISGAYADVQLTTDPRTSIDVVLPRTGSRGVLKGVASDSRYVCRVEYVLNKDDIQVGDAVVTSGLGGLFPRDMPIGKVVRTHKPDSSLYQEIEVEPLVDFGKLREVLVVLSPPPPPDPDAGKRPAEPARGIGVPR